jgi:hypothetical protein
VALALRLLAAANLFDLGGIPYSRLLVGYRGTFATAQVYSLFYAVTHRDLEHAILLDRVLGAATVPLVFALCRALRPGSVAFPAIAAGLLAVCPLHVLFSASDGLSIFSGFLCALVYLLVVAGGGPCLAAGALGLALLTQVRYENVLLALPPVVFLLLRRRRLAAALCAAAGLAYVPASLAAGISYQSHARLADAWRTVTSSEVLTNPFLAIPFLLGSAALVGLARRPWLAVAALAPGAVALSLLLATSESPHFAARVLSGWLVPAVVPAGFGLALLAERGKWARLATALLLLHFAIKPLRFAEALRARYLEIDEHEAFAEMLAAAPADATAVIVPDDALLRRSSGATVETMTKYAAIRSGLARPGPPLVGITDALEGRGPSCAGGGCLFFAGLPCSVGGINRFVPAQCAALARGSLLEPLASRTVRAAPFERCSIQAGHLRQDVCTPTETTVTFSLSRVRAR